MGYPLPGPDKPRSTGLTADGRVAVQEANAKAARENMTEAHEHNRCDFLQPRLTKVTLTGNRKYATEVSLNDL